jgi:lactate dehydrogenase-like 2-hydroxyacid dehydrogenase
MTQNKQECAFLYDAAFYEAFGEEEKSLKTYIPDGKRYYFTWKTIQEDDVSDKAPAPLISIRTQSKIPLSWAASLNAIITRSSGYDHITDYLKKTDAPILCAYLPDYAARAVAEQAMMMWVCLLRKLNLQKKSFERFHRDGLTGREIKGKTIAIIGVGRIGSQVADIARGLGMKIIGVDIAPQKKTAKKYKFEYFSLDDALEKAQIAVCALPLTDLTRRLLDYERLKKMPKNSIFVNIRPYRIYFPFKSGDLSEGIWYRLRIRSRASSSFFRSMMI